MPAIELFHQDGRTAGAWYCEKCRAVHGTEEGATLCHGESLCACGKPTRSRYDNQCQDCNSKAWRERMDREEMARYEKAVKVPQAEWTGYQVFWDDRYFDTVEEAVEHAEADGGSTPEYIWAAKNQGVPKATIEDLVSRLVEDMWEDAEVDDLNGVDELQTAVDAFNEANKSVTVWMVDYSAAIIVNQIEPETKCARVGETL